MCAEMVAELEPCYALVWHAAHAQKHMPNEARLMACQAKSHLSDVTKEVAKKSTEVHGGMGFTDLLGLHYWFKRIGLNRQLLGTPERVREEAASTATQLIFNCSSSNWILSLPKNIESLKKYVGDPKPPLSINS